MLFDGRRSIKMILAVAGVVGLTGIAASAAAMAGTGKAVAPQAAALNGTWRTPREIPGTGALNKGGYAQVNSVSCSSPGNCTAGGWYTVGPGRTEAFVVREAKGTWHTAIEVPGIAALNKARAQVNSVSCASAGNCSAGGFYASTTGVQAFVVSEVGGVWHKATEVPGSAALNTGGYAGLTSVSCGKPGNCTAGGYYDGPSTSYQGFVVSEVNGTWHKAVRVPGVVSAPANGHVGPTAQVNSVSCRSAGNCSIGGFYYDSSHIQAFVGSEVKGVWRKAVKVPGTAALNTGDAEINSVSCGSAGNCSAGGWYTDSAGYEQLMVVNAVNGTWHKAFEVPGTAALNVGDNAQVSSVSCASAGNCSAGGWYMDSSSLDAPLVVSEVNGTWHKAVRVPGITTLTRHIFGAVLSVSCSSAGNCSAGGWYTDSSDHVQPFVVSEVNGTWHNAVEVPGIATLNKGRDAGIHAVSCSSAVSCSALGSYTDSAKHLQVFVVNKT
jgi:hypothetical protein